MSDTPRQPSALRASAHRRRRDPAGRRRAIIDAAGRLIADSGLSGLTHRRVAELAGVPVGSTTYYFKDLDELREAALADAARAALDALTEWRERLADDTDVPATLARLITEYLADSDRYRALNELYAAAAYRPELRPLARMWCDGLVEVLEPRVGRASARAIAAFTDGVLMQALIHDEPLSATALTETIAKLA